MKTTHIPRRLRLLALFLALGIAGWQMPSLGSATLAASGKAVTAVRGALNLSSAAAPTTSATENTVNTANLAAQQNPGSKRDTPAPTKVRKNAPGQNVVPANDNCANAIPVLTCPFTDTKSTTDATDEAGEPASACTLQTNSVWYTISAGANGSLVNVSTCASNFDTAIMVWRVTSGDCNFATFVPVACNDDFCGDGLQSTVSFLAEAGQTYKIQIGGFDGSTGTLITNIDCTVITCPAISVHGTLGSNDPAFTGPRASGLQTGRLNRNGTASSCASPKACSPFDTAPGRAYDAYTFRNDSGVAACVTINLSENAADTNNLQSNVYLGSYDPNNICTNYLADPGLSTGVPPTPTSMSVVIPAGANFVVVVHTTNPGEIGGRYTLNVIGNICSGVNLGPGTPFPPTSAVSDQKAGSVLIYNVYTSGATSGNTQNTRINLTNVNPQSGTFVHLFFVAEGCAIADSYICLTANQTASFLASDLDPGTTGYIVAVAVNDVGCPAGFNYLIGDEYVKFSTGHEANLGAEAFSRLAPVACDGNSVTASLDFNGVNYNYVPRTLALDNIGSRADGNDTLLILNRIGGNLGIGASSLGTLFGTFYDDAENVLSFSITGNCQLRSSISNNFPRIAPRFETFVPAGRTGWLKVASQSDIGILGAAINFNPNAASSAGAFNQGHNLHKLTLSSAASYVIPIFPPSC